MQLTRESPEAMPANPLMSLAENRVQRNSKLMAQGWNTLMNGPPDAPYVNAKVWWTCANSHIHLQVISSHLKEEVGCPHCSERRVTPGETSLDVTHPALAAEWHFELNGSVTPSTVTDGTAGKWWWLCPDGHPYSMVMSARILGNNCPVCINYVVSVGVNDLPTTRPDLLSSWDEDRNWPLRPMDLHAGSHRVVWWVCKSGHRYQCEVRRRAASVSCRICAGHVPVQGNNDLETLRPDIAAEWHPTANGELSPAELKPQSNKVVWWVCALGHEYERSVQKRTTRSGGCPYCDGYRVAPGYNDVGTRYAPITSEWDHERNDLPPSEVLSPHFRAWWICANGHSMSRTIFRRVASGGCSECGVNERVARRPVRDRVSDQP